MDRRLGNWPVSDNGKKTALPPKWILAMPWRRHFFEIVTFEDVMDTLWLRAGKHTFEEPTPLQAPCFGHIAVLLLLYHSVRNATDELICAALRAGTYAARVATAIRSPDPPRYANGSLAFTPKSIPCITLVRASAPPDGATGHRGESCHRWVSSTTSRLQ